MALSVSEKVSTLFAVIEHVANRGEVPLTELAAEFNIEPDSLRQSLIEMFTIDLPPGQQAVPDLDLNLLETEEIVAFIDSPEFNAELEFTQTEAAALILGLEVIEPRLTAAQQIQSDTLKKRIFTHYKLKNWFKFLRVPDRLTDFTQLELLLDALENKETVWIEYVNAAGNVSKREIQPLELETSVENLIIRAHCFTADMPRSFRIDRIITVSPGQVRQIPTTNHTQRRIARAKVTFTQAPQNLKRAALRTIETEAGTQLILRVYNPAWLRAQLLLYADLYLSCDRGEAITQARATAQQLLKTYDLLTAKNH